MKMTIMPPMKITIIAIPAHLLNLNQIKAPVDNERQINIKAIGTGELDLIVRIINKALAIEIQYIKFKPQLPMWLLCYDLSP